MTLACRQCERDCAAVTGECRECRNARVALARYWSKTRKMPLGEHKQQRRWVLLVRSLNEQSTV